MAWTNVTRLIDGSNIKVQSRQLQCPLPTKLTKYFSVVAKRFDTQNKAPLKTNKHTVVNCPNASGVTENTLHNELPLVRYRLFLVWLLGVDFTLPENIFQYLVKYTEFEMSVTSWIKSDLANYEDRLKLRTRAIQKRSMVYKNKLNFDKERGRFAAFFSPLTGPDCSTSAVTMEWLSSLNDRSVDFNIAMMSYTRALHKSVWNVEGHGQKSHNVYKKQFPVEKMLLMNDSSLRWEDVTNGLIDDMEAGEIKSSEYTPLNPGSLMNIAKQIRSTPHGVTMPVDGSWGDTHLNNRYNLVQCICRNLPVFAITRGCITVFYDIHTMENGTDWWLVIQSNLQESRRKERPRKRNKEPDRMDNTGKTVNSGAIPIHKRFPNLPDVVCMFVKQNGVSAQERRRSGTYNVGVSLEDIRKQVLREIPEIINWGISVDTIHRMFMPPNRRNKAHKLYKGLIDAKVPGKRNNMRLDNLNAHACAAQVGSILEMVAEFPEDCFAMSLDDKAKVHVGTTAVSRYHQIRKFFHSDDAPNHLDHDFPHAHGYLLAVSGYMELKGDKV